MSLDHVNLDSHGVSFLIDNFTVLPFLLLCTRSGTYGSKGWKKVI